MKLRFVHTHHLWMIILVLASLCVQAAPMGTAFTYQGRLQAGGSPAQGIYDLQFALYDAPTGGNPVGGALTNTATIVTNGLLTATLDFGAAAFTGPERWLEIGVRAAGAGPFSILAPRQPIAPSPYALHAVSAGTAALATNLPSGTITAAMIADGAVTSSKIASGAVKSANLDDGGSAAYESLVRAGRSFITAAPPPFESLLLVATNGGTPSLAFALDGAAFGTVAGFVGHEGISKPYEFVVEVIAPAANLDPNVPLGRPGRVTFTRGGRVTAFAGIVTGCSVSSYDGASALYTFQLGSPLHPLALGRDYRIFQDVSVPDMVGRIYREIAGADMATPLSGSYVPQEFVMQHAESHLSFFSRLLEDEGIFYFFNQSVSLPVLTLGDGAASLLAAPYEVLRYYGNLATNVPPGAEFVRSFHKGAHQSAKRAAQMSYDFKRPRTGLYGTSDAPDGIGEDFRFGATLTDRALIDTRARIRAERQQLEHDTCSADGNAADLRPGYTFSLLDQAGSGLGGAYLVTSARHAAFRRVTNGVASFYYGNQLEVIPTSTPCRPAVQTPKPSAHSCTAVVVGAAGEEIYVDQYGRVKVQFRWDRSGTNDQNSSGWIRVASPWAGKNWGMIFLPRVGQEVIVDFLYGDPDQPVIVGSLYNADQMPPYALPANKTVSGIKTRSSMAGYSTNANEIRFDDKKDMESLDILGEKDLSLAAKNNATLSAGADLSIAARTILFSTGISIASGAAPAVALNTPGAVAAGSFQGDGSSLVNLSAAALGTGTVPDARLSANVALRSGGNSFTGSQVLTSGDLRLSDQPIYLRGGSDTLHGLAWYGTSTFAGANPDGPVLFGCGGGALGTMCSSPKLALAWNNLGNVVIDPGSQNSGSLAPGLTFGANSSEGIASKRTAGGNQYGLDFYTFGTNRLSIANGGNVGIGTTNPVRRLQVVDADGVGGSIQVGSQTAGPAPKLINFGDADFIHIGESGADDRLELKAASFFFTGGNVGLGTNAPQQKLHVVGNILATGTITPNSDRAAKTAFAPVDTAAVLEKIAHLPIQQWRFKAEAEEVKHVGPMAQDFRAAFGLGENPTAIATVDADGVALAAIQGLNKKLHDELQRRDAENAELKARLDRLEQLLNVQNAGGK